MRKALNWIFFSLLVIFSPLKNAYADSNTGYQRVLEQRELQATVSSKEPSSYVVELTDEENNVAVAMDSNIEQFHALKKGDVVNVQYTRMIQFKPMPKGSVMRRSERGFGNLGESGSPAERNSLLEYAMMVEINHVDLEEKTVTYTDRDGFQHLFEPADDAGENFIKQLSPYDRVDVIYTEKIEIVPGK